MMLPKVNEFLLKNHNPHNVNKCVQLDVAEQEILRCGSGGKVKFVRSSKPERD